MHSCIVPGLVCQGDADRGGETGSRRIRHEHEYLLISQQDKQRQDLGSSLFRSREMLEDSAQTATAVHGRHALSF